MLEIMGEMLRKVRHILKESAYLVRRHKLYFLAPIIFTLALLAFFVYQIGPAIIVSFIYAGV
jgi:hypothetical protein